MLEMLKVILLGIVEGITEWLPISSTGHLILVDEFIKLQASAAFKEMFNVDPAWCDYGSCCTVFS